MLLDNPLVRDAWFLGGKMLQYQDSAPENRAFNPKGKDSFPIREELLGPEGGTHAWVIYLDVPLEVRIKGDRISGL